MARACISVSKLLVDALRRAAQRQLAKGRQIGGGEEMLKRALGLLGDVDLAFLQALNQIVGRKVDELDGVGAIEDRIRHGFADADPSDLRHHIVEALDVLDVQGRIDVDAVAQQLLDIEVALGVPAARDIGVRQLIDQNDLRLAGNDGVEVHLLEPLPLVLDTPPRNDFEPLQQRLRLFAAVRLDNADNNIVAVLLSRSGLLQHLIGLADARGGADEDLQPAGTAFLPLSLFEQSVRGRPFVVIATVFWHQLLRPFGRFACQSKDRLAAFPSLIVPPRACRARD